MDGGGRLLRSMSEAGTGSRRAPRPRFAGAASRSSPAGRPRAPSPVERAAAERAAGADARRSARARRSGIALGRGVLFGAIGRSTARCAAAQYAAFVAAERLAARRRSPGARLLASRPSPSRACKELTPRRDPRRRRHQPEATRSPSSTPAALRDRLQALPLVQDATRPQALPQPICTIDVTEREPFALWQKDGQVSLIAADGIADRRRARRPLQRPALRGRRRAPTRASASSRRCSTAAGDLQRQGARRHARRPAALDAEDGHRASRSQLPEIGAAEALGPPRRARTRRARSSRRTSSRSTCASRAASRRGSPRTPPRSAPRRWPRSPRQGERRHELAPRCRAACARSSARKSAHPLRARHRHVEDRLPHRQAGAGRGLRHAAGPHPSLPHPRHRPPALARHQGRRRRRHGGGRERDPPRRRRGRAHGRRRGRRASSSTSPAAGSSSQHYSAKVAVGGKAVSDYDVHRVLEASTRHHGAPGPRRAAFAADRLLARPHARHPRPQGHDRRRARRRHACRRLRCGRGPQPDAGDRALPPVDRGHGGDALCGRPVGAGRRRGRARRRR